ncbi:uncharacterized protein LOC131289788 [Anopheles ziemanni]|uniref:uncharacterized protein LOC131260350 n=1 Tax=Anopheles coustani TaxID=139045 RepID=UPI00265B204D|nr:uncharacterized protein LOC131260350 [Anopheles coustani]XP_058118033.1 uncharacterized protein LOC131260350 [Anopheles coustani]XP_058175082.1 uncharacterized protein LOC131289788 [Anopheles ziemanni]
MELDNIFLNKLPIVAATGSEGGTWNHYAFIESTWGERKILLKIIVFSPLYNTPLSFLSEIDHEVLQQTAIRLEKPWDSFLQETKLALCTEGGANGFNYAVEENNFVWRKIVGPSLSFTYGSVILLRSQCLLSDVLSNSIATQNQLRNDVQLKNKVLHELKEEHEELLELQRQQEEDNRLYEIELITKCISILNEKKEVINHLKLKLAEDDDEEPEEATDQHHAPEQMQQQQKYHSQASTDPAQAFSQDEAKSSSPTSAWVDFNESEPFTLDSIKHDPEEHGVLPKRTKYQPSHRSATSTSVGCTSTVTRNLAEDEGEKRGPPDTQEDEFYNKNTEELLQQI